ncbi:MAG: CHAT domain-containing protein [Candidatus Helarchaeota archaeon]
MKDKNTLFKEAIDLNRNGKYKLAIEILENLLKTYESENNIPKIIDVIHQLNQNYFRLGNFDLSKDLILKSLEYSKEIDDKVRYSISLNLIGTYYSKLGDFQKAIKYLEESRQIKEELNDEKGLGITLSKLGSIFMHQSKLDLAETYIKKSLAINEKNNDLQGIAVNYSQLGSIYQYQANWMKAEKFFKKSLKLKKRINDKYGLGIAYNQLGIIYQYMDDWKKSLYYYKKSIDLKQSINDFLGIVKSYVSLGLMEYEMGDLNDSIDYYSQAIKMARDNDLKIELCNALLGLSRCLIDKNDLEQALSITQEALSLSKQIGDIDNEGQSLLLLARLEKNDKIARKHYKNAYQISLDNNLIFLQIDSLFLYRSRFEKENELQILNSILELAELVGDKQIQSKTLREIGEIYNKQYDYEKAMEFFEESIKIGQGFERVKTIFDISQLEIKKSEWDKAFSKLNKIYEESLKNDQLIYAAFILATLGLLLRYRGDYPKAEEYYKKAIEINKKVNPIKVAGNLGNLGVLALKTSDFDKALRYFRESLKLNMENKNKFGIAIGLNQIGQVYVEKAQYNEALEYFNKSLQIKRIIGDKMGESISLNAIGSIYNELDDFKKALQYFEKSLEIKQTIGDKYGIGRVNGNIAKIYIELKELDKAKEYQKKALKIANQIRDIESQLYGNYYSGILELKNDNLNKALKFFETSLNISKEINDIMAEAMNLSKIAEIKFINGQLLESRELFINSIKKFNDVNLRIRKSSDRISLNKIYHPIFGKICSVLIDCWKEFKKQDFLKEALSYAELGKSRELLSSITIKHQKNEKYIESTNKLNNIREQIFILQNQFDEKLIKAQEFNEKYNDLKRKASDIEEFLWKNFPDPQIPPPENPKIIIDRFFDVMNDYKQNWLILEYVPDLENHRLNIFLINRSSIDVSSENINIDQYNSINTDLNDIIKAFHSKEPDFVNNLVKKLSLKLSDFLIPESFRPKLQNIDYLIIIPHGLLHNIPFELIYNNNSPIGISFPIIRALSLDILRSSIETKVVYNKNILIVGNPNRDESTNGEFIGLSNEYTIDLNLPIAENEAQKIENLLKDNNFNVVSLYSKDATKHAFINNSNKKSLVHFAGHSVFIGKVPEMSFLILSGPEKFTASEITNKLSFDSSLIILSACQSGTSKVLSGDELFGIVRSFILAGADSLVLSIWPVYDTQATQDFMLQIYNQLIQNNNIATSVYLARKAIYDNIHSGKYESDTIQFDLLLWGTFFIMGNPFISL